MVLSEDAAEGALPGLISFRKGGAVNEGRGTLGGGDSTETATTGARAASADVDGVR